MLPQPQTESTSFVWLLLCRAEPAPMLDEVSAVYMAINSKPGDIVLVLGNKKDVESFTAELQQNAEGIRTLAQGIMDPSKFPPLREIEDGSDHLFAIQILTDLNLLKGKVNVGLFNICLLPPPLA